MGCSPLRKNTFLVLEGGTQLTRGPIFLLLQILFRTGLRGDKPERRKQGRRGRTPFPAPRNPGLSQQQQADSKGGSAPSLGRRWIAIKPEPGRPRPRGALLWFLGWSGRPPGNFSARRGPVTLSPDNVTSSHVRADLGFQRAPVPKPCLCKGNLTLTERTRADAFTRL